MANLRKNRISRAQQVVEKARRRNAEQGNVENLPTTRLEHGTADGKATLMAIFPKKGGGNADRLDLSFLLDFPGLTHLFGVAILVWAEPLAPTSRAQGRNALRRCWFKYLSESKLYELVPEDLDEQIMAGFKIWLNQRTNADDQPLDPSSSGLALSTLRCVLRGAPQAERWVDLVPTGPRGLLRRTEPTSVLQYDELLTVMAAAEKEVLGLRDRLAVGQRLVTHGRDLLRRGSVLECNPQRRSEARSESNLALCLAMLDQRYPSVIPDLEALKADDYLLGSTVRALGSKQVTRYFYATGRDLVPLALSLAFATAFNPYTILTLQWKNIDRNVDRLSNGRSAVQFDVTEDDDESEKGEKKPTKPKAFDLHESPLAKVTGDKPRAQRQLVRLLDPEASGPDQVSLNLVLDLLTSMTARIRAHVTDPDTFGDRVFLFVQETAAKRPKGFGNSLRACDIVWDQALKNFIADNKLPYFTLKTIRATLLDYVQLFNRGDLEAARQVGNHGSRVTTWTHYTSNLVKRLLQEVTGETLLVRERWLESNGKLDPRKHREWMEKGCATPGWICLDPFDSPRPHQKQGRLCKAFGECPDCPLSAARPNNPRSIMFYEALRRAIYRSITRVTAHVWQQRWAPVVTALDALLAQVPPTVLEESRKFRVELPDIG